MKLLLASSDLMIASRVEGAARKLGLKLVSAATESQVVSLCTEQDVAVLLIDLRLPNLELEKLVTAVREVEGTGVPIIACGPHVHETRLAAAREAGCEMVVTRGQLDRDLDSILQQLLTKDS